LGCSRHVRIDLHIHTTASDGTLTPVEIIDHALQLDLKAIAITDHDTVEGSRIALQAGIPPSLGFLTGVEISTAPPSLYPGLGSFHILGYSIRLDDPELNRILKKLRQARKNRNPAILNRLNDLGIPITLEEVREESGAGQLGRPHIAQLMVKKGVVASIDEAFEHFLGPGKPAYVDKYRIGYAKAIEIIQGAGGIAVLAHPGLLNIDDEHDLDELIVHLKKVGIKGVEVYYSEHDADQTRRFADLAERHHLLQTGGTDFHGTTQPEIKMGSGKGNLFIPYEVYEKLIQSSSTATVSKQPHTVSQKATGARSTVARKPMDLKDQSEIELRLRYEFKNKCLLEEALRHSSYVNESTDLKLRDNERLEFLGDAVLNLIVGHILMVHYPDLAEGDLSRSRANLVNETQLAQIARSLHLGSYIQLGKGEIQTQGREKNSILADSFEALMAAVYLDGGFEAVFQIIKANFLPLIDDGYGIAVHHDYKSQLQEWAQLRYGVMPNYRVIREEGPDHDKTFWVTLKVSDVTTEGIGKSKKTAEQNAAQKALEILSNEL
jgi:3',5'-nucleoside bisphosphate phosphatase